VRQLAPPLRFPPKTLINLLARRVLVIAMVGAIALAHTSCTAAGILDRLLGIAGPIAAEKLLKEDPPITTSFTDAVTEIPFLDNFNPPASMFLPVEMMPPGEGRGYHLRHGLYALEAQGYCLQAGTYGPSKGEGFLYAPLEGPRAEIVQNLLRRSLKSEVPQHDVQLLLWAITSRTKLSDMAPQNQQTAVALLTKEELFDLNGGALGLIPDDVMQTAIVHLPPQVQQIYYKEQQIRRLLTSKSNSSYEQFERLAVLTGVAPAESKIRDVPRGRWSYHQDGYFVRYLPSGYRQVRFELFRPLPFKIERDKKGRITALDDGGNIRVETVYRETNRAAPAAEGLEAHQLSSVRLIFGVPSEGNQGPGLQKSVRTSVWTLVETGSQPAGKVATPPVSIKQRKALLKQREQLAAMKDKTGKTLDSATRKEILDVMAYVDTLRLILEVRGVEGWVPFPLFMLAQAPYAALALALSHSESHLGPGTWVFDPTGHVIVPANTYGQRLVSDGRPVRESEQFANQVEASGGQCPESIRQKIGDKNSYWQQSPTGPQGHWYLTLNSLGETDISAEQTIDLLKRYFTLVFPDGGARAFTPRGWDPRQWDLKQEIARGRWFWLTQFHAPVEVTEVGNFSWTLKSHLWHPFAGTAVHGVCKDSSGELWMFQEGFGVPDEYRAQQWFNYIKASKMWRDMAAKTRRLMRDCRCELPTAPCTCLKLK